MPDRLLQKLQEAATRDWACSKPLEILGSLLAVDEREAERVQAFDHSNEGDLRGVGLAIEHRLGEERATQRHSIDAALKLPVPPALEAVGMAFPMKSRVGVDHLGGNPGPGLGASRHSRTSLHHSFEVGVEPYFESAPMQRASQRSTDVKIARKEHEAWVG